MTRAKAIGRVKKLRALAADKAATKPEKALALQRAEELIERFELLAAEIAPDPVRRPRPRPVPVWGVAVTFTTTATTSASTGNVFFTTS